MGTTKWTSAVLVALMPLLLMACSDDNKSSKMTAAEAEAAACQDLSTLRSPIDQLKTIDPATATIGDVKKLSQEFVSSLKSLDDIAANVKSARVADFETAVRNLEKSIKGVSDNTTLQEASAGAKAAADGVRSSWTEATDGLGCTPAK